MLKQGDRIEAGGIYAIAPGTVITNGEVTRVRECDGPPLEVHVGHTVDSLQLWFGYGTPP